MYKNKQFIIYNLHKVLVFILIIMVENKNNLSGDDNDEIMTLLQARLKLGRERYGHGVRVNDDTTQWGTPTNDWEEMAMEEVLDGLIYAAAAIIRCRKRKTQQ